MPSSDETKYQGCKLSLRIYKELFIHIPTSGTDTLNIFSINVYLMNEPNNLIVYLSLTNIPSH